MSRILIHQPDPAQDDSLSLLEARGDEVIWCRDREALVVALTEHRPAVLVYVFADVERDLALLARLRGIAPTLPIILLGGPLDLASRRSIQELKPTYYGVLPLELFELRDVVRGVLEHARVAATTAALKPARAESP